MCNLSSKIPFKATARKSIKASNIAPSKDVHISSNTQVTANIINPTVDLSNEEVDCVPQNICSSSEKEINNIAATSTTAASSNTNRSTDLS